MKKKTGVYLDGAANTPLDKRVLKVMKPFLKEDFIGNSHAIHDFGINALVAIEDARNKIASALKLKPGEVYFTSGATESNNWVIKSVAINSLINNTRKHIVCSAIEHASVLKACQEVEKWGIEVTYVKPNAKGKILARSIKKALRPDTALICVMAVNNETGCVCEADQAAAYAKKQKTLSLIDITQLVGYGGKYMEIGKTFPHGDFFSFSAHKIYGPTGVGCLIARKDITLDPFIIGGAQEGGKRGGTSNTAGIVGLGEAVRLLHDNTSADLYFEGLYNYLKKGIIKLGGKLNAIPDHKNIVSICMADVLHEESLAASLALCGIAVSAGSACDAEHDDIFGPLNPSHVLDAMGLSEDEIRNTVRVSFTLYNTTKDIDELLKALEELIHE